MLFFSFNRESLREAAPPCSCLLDHHDGVVVAGRRAGRRPVDPHKARLVSLSPLSLTGLLSLSARAARCPACLVFLSLCCLYKERNSPDGYTTATIHYSWCSLNEPNCSKPVGTEKMELPSFQFAAFCVNSTLAHTSSGLRPPLSSSFTCRHVPASLRDVHSRPPIRFLHASNLRSRRSRRHDQAHFSRRKRRLQLGVLLDQSRLSARTDHHRESHCPGHGATLDGNQQKIAAHRLRQGANGERRTGHRRRTSSSATAISTSFLPSSSMQSWPTLRKSKL